ncbi:hypothetical protein C8R44DRAFT_879734 [Mycena epipterygia]|nr:hypothetical protein C8R44DRAFT_879734 [Mycena epipterygia]
MTSTCAPTLDRPDFKASLRSLSSSIENAMVSWHDVRTTSLRTSSHPMRLRTSFAPLTNSLQSHWVDIQAYLQKCHTFSEDAITCNKFLEQDPDPDAFSLLEELASSSDEMCRESEILIQKSDVGIECLSSLTPQLSDLLSKYAKATSTMFSRPDTERTHVNLTALPKTTAFLGASWLPDGFAAIASTNTALTEIRYTLCMMHQFWIVASQTCHSLAKSNANIAQERVQDLAETWKEYQAEIMSATVSIAKSLDAVAVEPAAPPSFRRQPWRRGSSKSQTSQTSLPTSPLLLPRRRSSLKDDEILRTCWGFGGLKKR